MQRPSQLAYKINTSVDRFTSQARTPHGHEFLEQHIMDLPFTMRMAKRALLAAHDHNPDFFYNRLAHPYQKLGYTVLGVGLCAVALLDGSGVKKIYRNTVGLDEDKQAEIKSYWEQKQSRLLEYLPDYAVPQEFAIDSHPVDSSKSVVVARQPYIQYEKIIHLPFTSSSSERESSFRNACFEMHNIIGALPDIVGLSNVFDTKDGIKIIDTIPLESADPSDEHSYTLARELFGI